MPCKSIKKPVPPFLLMLLHVSNKVYHGKPFYCNYWIYSVCFSDKYSSAVCFPVEGFLVNFYENGFSDFSVLHHAFIFSEMGGSTKRRWRKIYIDDIVNTRSETIFRKRIQMQNILVKLGLLSYVRLSELELHLSRKNKHLISLATRYIIWFS